MGIFYLMVMTAAFVLCACQKGSDTLSREFSTTSLSATIRESMNASSQPDIPTAGIPPTSETEGSGSTPGAAGKDFPDNPAHSQSAGKHSKTGGFSAYTSSKPSGQNPDTGGPGTGPTSGSSNSSITSTTITTTTATTTTTALVKSPWVYPYDISAITQECKKEITRVGFVWDDNLTKERSSWDHPHSTGVYTEFPSMFSLKEYVMDEMIPFYIENKERYSIKRCKIWFEPDVQYPGDYNIYFLYRPDSA